MTPRIGILTALLALATSAEAACILPPATLGFSDALAVAACRNPALQKAAAQRAGKAAELELAQAAQRPTAGISTGYNRSELDTATFLSPAVTETTQYALSGSWVAWDGGARQSATQGATHGLRAADAGVLSTQDAVVRQVTLAWLHASLANARIRAFESAERLASELVKVARVKRDAGLVTGAEVLQPEAEWRQAQYRLRKAQLDAERSLTVLAQAMGTPGPVKVTYDLEPLARALGAERGGQLPAAVIEQALGTSVVRAAEAQVAANQAAVDAARAAFRPTVTLALERQGSQTNGTDAGAWVARAVLNVPLYTGGARDARVRAAAAALDAQRATAAEVRLSAEAASRDALERVPLTRDAWAAARLAETAAREAAKLTAGRYAAGVGPLQDVLRSRAALETAELTQLEAQTDHLTALVELHYLTGTLTATLAPAEPLTLPTALQ